MGSRNDSWDMFSVATNLFYYHSFRTDDKINYKKNWFMVPQKKAFISKTVILPSDETFKKIVSDTNEYKKNMRNI